MALCYAIGDAARGPHLRGTPPLVVALASTAVATLAVLPRRRRPGAVASARLEDDRGRSLVLGFVGTAIAYLLYFALIQAPAPRYATLVTYLVPPIALFYGAVFLDESFGAIDFAVARAHPRRRRARDRRRFG